MSRSEFVSVSALGRTDGWRNRVRGVVPDGSQQIGASPQPSDTHPPGDCWRGRGDVRTALASPAAFDSESTSGPVGAPRR